MRELEELKARWFIPMDGSTPDGVPCRRQIGETGANAVSISTDGNTVVPLIDGQAYMAWWHFELLALHGEPEAELFHAGWCLERIKTLGPDLPGTDALEDIEAAFQASVATYVLLSRHVGAFMRNAPSVGELQSYGVLTSCLDNRFPAGGSNHQKFAVMKRRGAAKALLGSVDISTTRWDTPEHLPNQSGGGGTVIQRKPTHDAGVAIEGPAVTDIETTFRERWNDATSKEGLDPAQPPITSTVSSPTGTGTHSVQVLRTYGIAPRSLGYSWARVGEFTVWASYLNAIKRAVNYIYIEDQYFLPFGWAPCYSLPDGPARDTDLIYQLGMAILRGVRVAVLTPSNAEDPTHVVQKYQRDVGVNHLLGIKAAGALGDVVVASLHNGQTDVYVHSKLMIVDDEFALIGSANFGQRSMSYDGELHIGVVDAANRFARELRTALWAEHTGIDRASFDDPSAAFATFKAAVANHSGHLKPYPVDENAVYPPGPFSVLPPPWHPGAISKLVDPYAGLNWLR